MKNRGLLFFISITLLIGCKIEKSVETYDYKGEPGELVYYNFSSTEKPLVVIIPEPYNSVITEKQIEQLASKNRVVLINFIGYNDLTRLQQVDNLENRTTYYSDVLTSLELNSKSKIISEGFNSLLALKLGLSFNQPELLLINSWYPTIKEHLTINCYSQQNNQCDSLIAFLNFSSKQSVDDLLKATAEGSADKQYGNHTLSVWEDFFNYNSRSLLKNYSAPIQWIYTKNSGLLNEKEQSNLLQSTGKRKNTLFFSRKDYRDYNLNISK